MRVAIAALLFSVVPFVAHADEAKPAKKKTIDLGEIQVDGHRPTPVQLVMPRNEQVKKDLNSINDEHLNDRAEHK